MSEARGIASPLKLSPSVIEQLSSGKFPYNYCEPISCQVGCLVAVLNNIDQDQLDTVLEQEREEGIITKYFWMWSNMYQHSPVDSQGEFKSYLLQSLRSAGFTHQELCELENLTDAVNLNRALTSLGRDYVNNTRYENNLVVVVSYLNEKVKEMEKQTQSQTAPQPVV